MNTEATHIQNEVLSTGVRLRNAREKFGLSQKAVAERLCLKVSTVRDIEEDKSPADLALTFLRGYIRSYAKLVHIPEDELLLMMEEQTPINLDKVSQMQSISLDKAQKKRDGWLVTFTWLILCILISITGAWWWKSHQVQQEEMIATANQPFGVLDSMVQEAPLNADVGSVVNEVWIAKKNLSDDLKRTQTNMQTPTNFLHGKIQNNPVSSPFKPEIDMPPMRLGNISNIEGLLTDQFEVDKPVDLNALVMNFTADCWLELIDATGKKLFSGLQRKNAKLNIIGQPPYKLKIGAPAAVQIWFQGKAVDLNRFIKSKQIARLTINVDKLAVQ